MTYPYGYLDWKQQVFAQVMARGGEPSLQRAKEEALCLLLIHFITDVLAIRYSP